MRIKTFLASLIALAFMSQAWASPVSSEDLPALQKVAEATDKAWDAADAEAMSRYFTEDATLRVGDGAIQRSRADIRSYFQRSFTGRPTTMRHVTQITNMEMVSSDVAIAELTVSVEQKGADETWKPVRRFLNYSTLRRERGEWLLVHVRAVPRS